MKKFIINEDWELEEVEDHGSLFVVTFTEDFGDAEVLCYGEDPDHCLEIFNAPIDRVGVVNYFVTPNTRAARDAVKSKDSAIIQELITNIDSNMLDARVSSGLEEARKRKRKKRQPKISYSTGYLAYDTKRFNQAMGTDFDSPTVDTPESSDSDMGDSGASGEGFGEALKLNEAKRYVKRYYIRPQNIFCSNKEDILKALVKIDDQNCSVYSLKNLADHDDVHLLKPSDIIYYYDEGILYDKNHVKVLDYDLNVKHEEERRKVADVDQIADHEFDQLYDDRMTKANLKDREVLEAVDKKFECCICGDESTGHGHNPFPVMDEGRCCDACNMKFVVPARYDAFLKSRAEENKEKDED